MVQAEIGQLQAQLRTSVDAAAAHEVEDLMEKLNAKTEELSNHKEKLREVIEKWEDNAQVRPLLHEFLGQSFGDFHPFFCQELRKNHCKDKEELEKIKTKHRDLKQKYRTLHKNYSRMEEHYKGEISRQRNEWMVQLEEYKTKMDAAYGAREKKVIGAVRVSCARDIHLFVPRSRKSSNPSDAGSNHSTLFITWTGFGRRILLLHVRGCAISQRRPPRQLWSTRPGGPPRTTLQTRRTGSQTR